MKRKPKQILHQPLDTLSDAQTEVRWEALCDHYGIRFGAHDWRTSLLCALASDFWAGFRSTKNKRGKPNKISDPLLLLYVACKAQNLLAPDWAASCIDRSDIERVSRLLAALQLELQQERRRASASWLVKRLSKHKHSPWKGQRPETLRSTIRALRKRTTKPVQWRSVSNSDLKTSLRAIAKVPSDDYPFWIPPTYEELYGYDPLHDLVEDDEPEKNT